MSTRKERLKKLAQYDKTYSEDPIYDAGVILKEIVHSGKSNGWSGDSLRLDELEQILERFNVHYVDDFNGDWALGK